MAAQERLTPDPTPPVPEPRRLVMPPTQATQPPALTSTPDASSLFKALRRRWFLAGALGLLAAGIVGTAAWMLLPARYTAFALLQVASKPTQFTQPTGSREDFTIVQKTIAA